MPSGSGSPVIRSQQRPVDSQGTFCYSWGCTELCDSDLTCATDSCVNGSCQKTGVPCDDSSTCTALTCNAYSPWSNSPFTDGFCQPKNCLKDQDCGDPDWFCRPFGTAQTKSRMSPTIRPVGHALPVAQRLERFVGMGRMRECAYTYGCLDGICSAPCESNEDCLVTPNASWETWNIDVDDDDVTDTYVNIDLCQAWPTTGDIIDCTEDADCGEGAHCQFRLAKAEPADDAQSTQWKVEYKCRADFENQAEFGEPCGSFNGKQCGSDLCLVPSNSDDGTPNLCTKYCKTSADCPETVFYDGFTWKTTCLSFNVNENQSLTPSMMSTLAIAGSPPALHRSAAAGNRTVTEHWNTAERMLSVEIRMKRSSWSIYAWTTARPGSDTNTASRRAVR